MNLKDCEFEGQIAIVTGGAHGIGRAISIMFAGRGVNVVVADIDLSGARETVAMMKGRQNLCMIEFGSKKAAAILGRLRVCRALSAVLSA